MPVKKLLIVLSLAGLGGGSAALMAAEKGPTTPLVSSLLACRSVTDSGARLACFDRTVENFDSAIARNDVVVVDKATMREARRGIFGFALPRIKLFGGGNADEPAPIQSIDAKITGVGQAREGWLLTLDSGARWEQIDGETISRPRDGQSVTIARALMGGYTAKVERGRAFRVRRLPE